MPRRVIDNFSQGMNTDAIGAEHSLYQLHDAFVKRTGEIRNRGPILAHSGPISGLLGYATGWTAANFHPNIGVGACRSYSNSSADELVSQADGFQLLASPLRDDADVDAGQTFPHLIFTPVSENGTGTTQSQVCLNVAADEWLSVEECRQAVNTGNEIVFAGVFGSLFKWGGSLLSPYSTGTVAVVNTPESPSAIITGTGTTWSTNIEAGQFILIDGIAETALGHQRAFRITKVHSNTELEIETPVYLATGNTGLSYRVQTTAVVQSPGGVWNRTNERPTGTGVLGYHNSRLIMMGVASNDTDYNTVFDYDRFQYSGTVSEVNNSFFSGIDLWGANAWAPVFPGHGGAGRGVASMGNDMIIIKAHALFRVSGGLGSYDGTGAVPAIQLINGAENVGASGLNAWGMCKRGLVVASSDGLYLYDGAECRSVTDGKVSRWWAEYFSGLSFRVLVYEDKVIITPEASQGWDLNTVLDTSLVWDLDRNIFWTIDSELPLGPAFTVYTSRDNLIGQYCLPSAMGPNPTSGRVSGDDSQSFLSHINESGGSYPSGPDRIQFLGPGTSSSSTALPIPSVITHPIPLGEDQLGEGRVNNLAIHGKVVGDSYVAGLTRGHISPDDVSQTVDEMEYGIDAGTEDAIHRVPVDAFGVSPSARVHIYDSSPGGSLHLYAIGVDFEMSDVIGPAT